MKGRVMIDEGEVVGSMKMGNVLIGMRRWVAVC